METRIPPRETASVMVVDDSPGNLQILCGMLREQGYKVRPVPDGKLALQAARSVPPDLILLDILMPGMSGYEVCEKLKADPALKDIPVLFISALNETLDKVKAFGAGGLDYITKPFQLPEVEARVATHLKLRKFSVALEALVSTRTRQLQEAHGRLSILDKTKSDFLALISHELRTPLNGLLGIASLLFEQLEPDQDTAELLKHYENSRSRMLGILDDALLLTQIQADKTAFDSEPVSLHSIVSDAIKNTADCALSHQVNLDYVPLYDMQIAGEKGLMLKALQSLLETAVRFSKPGQSVKLACGKRETDVLLTMETRGRTVPADTIARFFEVFSVAESLVPEGDIGLRPAIAGRILSLYGGSVSIENLDPPGIRFIVRLKPQG